MQLCHIHHFYRTTNKSHPTSPMPWLGMYPPMILYSSPAPWHLPMAGGTHYPIWIDDNTNTTSYAVCTWDDNVFITPLDTLTHIPILPANISTSSTTASTWSTNSKNLCSRRTLHTNTPLPSIKPPPPLPPVDIVSIPDDTSWGDPISQHVKYWCIFHHHNFWYT